MLVTVDARRRGLLKRRQAAWSIAVYLVDHPHEQIALACDPRYLPEARQLVKDIRLAEEMLKLARLWTGVEKP